MEFYQSIETPSVAEVYESYREFELVVDSRLVGNPEKSLFFALVGERRDGHQFIASLVRQGVRTFVVARGRIAHYHAAIREAERETPRAPATPQITLFVVDDPAQLLRQLAAFHRRQFNIPVVAITGSNGKTIVKDWLVQLLSAQFVVCGSPRSYNSLIGLPLSVWQLNDSHQIGVFEVGISQAGDMETLRDLLRPTCGILTHVGTAHLSNYESPEQLKREKLLLFEGVDWVLFPQDSEELQLLIGELKRPPPVVTWSGEGNQGLRIHQLELEDLAFPTLTGVYLDNARMAAAAAHLLNIELRNLTAGVGRLVPLKNRLEQREGRDGGPVINDSYSNDFTALGAALSFAESQDTFGKYHRHIGHGPGNTKSGRQVDGFIQWPGGTAPSGRPRQCGIRG